MPVREAVARRRWRRHVAEGFVVRLDAGEELFLVGSGPEDRREMLRVAELLPDDVVAELYEDPWYPGWTFMELYLVPAPAGYAPPSTHSDPWDEQERAV